MKREDDKKADSTMPMLMLICRGLNASESANTLHETRRAWVKGDDGRGVEEEDKGARETDEAKRPYLVWRITGGVGVGVWWEEVTLALILHTKPND